MFQLQLGRQRLGTGEVELLDSLGGIPEGKTVDYAAF
jgi:hypothetical protein